MKEPIDLKEYRSNLYQYEGIRPCPCYSEDGVILKIFNDIGVSHKPLCVEFGETRVLGTTTRSFRMKYISKAVYFTGNITLYSHVLNILDVFKATIKKLNLRYLSFLFSMPYELYVNSTNIVSELKKKFTGSVDVLTADIDSYDYYVVEEILKSEIRPRLLIVEYNPNLPTESALSWPRDKERESNENPKLYGASYAAWMILSKKFKYELVHITGMCNLFFIPTELNPGYKMPDHNQDITSTKASVLEFCEKYCLPGFIPSWIDAVDLNESDLQKLDTISEETCN